MSDWSAVTVEGDRNRDLSSPRCCCVDFAKKADFRLLHNLRLAAPLVLVGVSVTWICAKLPAVSASCMSWQR